MIGQVTGVLARAEAEEKGHADHVGHHFAFVVGAPVKGIVESTNHKRNMNGSYSVQRQVIVFVTLVLTGEANVNFLFALPGVWGPQAGQLLAH